MEKKKETITESAGRQQKKKIGKNPVNSNNEVSQSMFCLLIHLYIYKCITERQEEKLKNNNRDLSMV